MRSIKSSLFSITVAGFCGLVTVFGCSAEGSTDVIDDSDATEPAKQPEGTQLPPSLPPSSTPPGEDNSEPTSDGGTVKKDAAPKDSGPTAPAPGDPCTTVDQIFKRTCGACGKQQAICLAGEDGAAPKVDEYGACTGEVADGCIPGTTEQVDCGNCGTATRTCNTYCAWSTSTCSQPTNSCKPGTIEYTNASCPSGQYRKRECQATCQWTSFSQSPCAAPVNDIVLDINGTVGSSASKEFTLTSTQVASRLGGNCPSASLSSGSNYPYEYVEVKNTTAKAATVTIYLSKATGGTVIDTVMAAYASSVQPMDDAGRKACTFGVNDQSAGSDPTGDTNFSILKAVTIPAGGSVLAYVGTWVAYSATNPSSSTGKLKINVKTDKLQ